MWRQGDRGRVVLIVLAIATAFQCLVAKNRCNGILHGIVEPESFSTVARHLKDDGITAEDLMYKYGSDKSRDDHGYTKLYDMILGPIRHRVTNVTEVGMSAGQSIQAWYRYFPNADIHGIDILWKSEAVKANLHRLGPRFHGHIANVLETPPRSIGLLPETMDVVIEDGPHTVETQIQFLVALFPLVRPGGYYVVEDVSQRKGGWGAFVERPETLPPAARDVLESNDAVLVDASSGHRAWDEWTRRVTETYAQNRTHHNSFCLVIRRRERPLRPMRMNFGAGAMDPDSIVREDAAAGEGR